MKLITLLGLLVLLIVTFTSVCHTTEHVMFQRDLYYGNYCEGGLIQRDLKSLDRHMKLMLHHAKDTEAELKILERYRELWVELWIEQMFGTN